MKKTKYTLALLSLLTSLIFVQVGAFAQEGDTETTQTPSPTETVSLVETLPPSQEPIEAASPTPSPTQTPKPTPEPVIHLGGLWIKVTMQPGSRALAESEGTIALYTKDGEWIGTQTLSTREGEETLYFDTEPYQAGDTFFIQPTKGIDSLSYDGRAAAKNEMLTLNITQTGDELTTTFSVVATPECMPEKNIFVTVDGKDVECSVRPVIVNGRTLIPLRDFTRAIGIPDDYVYFEPTEQSIHIKYGGAEVKLYIDNVNTVLNGQPWQLDSPPILLDGKTMIPARFIAETFGYIVDFEEYERDVVVKVTKKPQPQPTGTVDPAVQKLKAKNQFVNQSGVSSRTDYLIWISLKDFEVNVFIGEEGNWNIEKVVPCTIGASSSPTVTGQFEYFSLESRWTYENFYVGPIMRFYKGYAIHTTLLKYDGTNYDSRVGKKLSHGCVRVRPADMQWLVYYVPKYTKVYITP
jgi:hypothetical protein